MKRVYTLDSFTHLIFQNEKDIVTSGYRTDSGGYDVNYSSLLTRLIQEAGRWCRRYASDLFISWDIINRQLKDGTIESGSFLFGFREDGVDGNSFVLARCNDSNIYGSNVYRALWRLDIEVEDERKVTMTLYECART